MSDDGVVIVEDGYEGPERRQNWFPQANELIQWRTETKSLGEAVARLDQTLGQFVPRDEVYSEMDTRLKKVEVRTAGYLEASRQRTMHSIYSAVIAGLIIVATMGLVGANLLDAVHSRDVNYRKAQTAVCHERNTQSDAIRHFLVEQQDRVRANDPSQVAEFQKAIDAYHPITCAGDRTK